MVVLSHLQWRQACCAWQSGDWFRWRAIDFLGDGPVSHCCRVVSSVSPVSRISGQPHFCGLSSLHFAPRAVVERQFVLGFARVFFLHNGFGI